MKSVTKSRSKTRERTSVMELGRKSDGMSCTYIFATESIVADFNWLGLTEFDNDNFIILIIRATKNGAPTR
jgi:hypothetical protein